MLVEAVSFAVAAVVHLGHRIGPVSGELATGTAVVELIMAGLVGLGALAVLTGALRARLFAFLVTLLAVIGVIYQLVTISLATGPRTIPDLGFDIAMMAVLLISLAVLTNRRRYD
jgi:hypothetical protein